MKPFQSMLSLASLALGALSVDAQRTSTAVIDILSYNDIYELLQDTVDGLDLGGPSRVVPIAKELRTKNPNSLVLFSGDTMSPSLWSSQFKGMQMVDAHNAIGTDFGCLGNHEFDFGLEAFWNVTNGTNFVWLNSNVYENSTGELLRGTQPNAVVEFNNTEFGAVKIGLFGLLYDMNTTTLGIYWEDVLTAAKEQVDILKNDYEVDLVIALSHQNFADDNELSAVEGIDIIYGGHDHVSMLQTNYGAPYLKSDLDFRSIWLSRIEFFNATGKLNSATRFTYESVPITQDLPTDAELDAIIQEEYSDKINAIYNESVGTLYSELDLRNKIVRTQDCAVGALFADSFLNFYSKGSADISVMNGGGIRTDEIYEAGDVTLGTLVSWHPFGNAVMITETNGASLKAFVTREMLASCGDGVVVSNGLYVHPGGFKYTFSCTAEGVGSVTSMEWHNHPTNTSTIADTDVFKLALSNYLYNIEFNVIDRVVSSLTVHESEAERSDLVLQDYVESTLDGRICMEAGGRSSVAFSD